MSANQSLERVRVEDDSSIGRSYSSHAQLQKGLGEARRALKTKTFRPDQTNLTAHSFTLAKCHLSKASRQDVLEYFRNTWHLTDTLFTGLVNDSVFYMIPDKLRRPLVFYFGHAAALYANKLNVAGLCDNVNMFYQKLFETGVDEMSWDDMDEMQDEDFAWPSVAETQAFRDKVKKVVEEVIMTMPEPSQQPVTQDSPYWALFMGFEHERIHLETSSVLFRQLPIDVVQRPEVWTYCPKRRSSPADVPKNQLLAVAEGVSVVGKPAEFPSFGWDNEYGKTVTEVPSFKASKFLVTNAEFLPFVLEGGYRQKKYWVSPLGDDEGWRWAQFRNATHPSFWVATKDMPEYFGGRSDYPYQKDDGHPKAGSGKEFKYRAEFDIIDMPWDWPVDVNYLEARAFLNWKGEKDGCVYRMPTEAEYHRMRGDAEPWDESSPGKTAVDDGVKLDSAEAEVDVMMQPRAPGNVNMRFGSSSPVDMFPASFTGFYDTHGNVWEWVEDHFAGPDGFKIHYLYDDFSTPCFDGWHTMMMGGSWVSTGDQASNFARYAFRRHFFQHLGFRYVRVDAKEEYPGAATVRNLWEGHGNLSKELTNGFGDENAKLPFRDVSDALSTPQCYEKRLRQFIQSLELPSSARVLLLGASVGSLSMALSSLFDTITAVEKSEPLVRHARILQHHGQLEYQRTVEGVLNESNVVFVDPSARRQRVNYLLEDPEHLSDSTIASGPFDLVVVDGALEAAVQPLNIINALRGVADKQRVVSPGGKIVISSSCDWNPSITPRNSWLGGFSMNGEDMSTFDMLKTLLRKSYHLSTSTDIPRMVREHARKFTVSIMQVTAWSAVGDSKGEDA